MMNFARFLSSAFPPLPVPDCSKNAPTTKLIYKQGIPVYYLFDYHNIKPALTKYKYKNNILVLNHLSKCTRVLIEDILSQHNLNPRDVEITFAPINFVSLLRRGHNQSKTLLIQAGFAPATMFSKKLFTPRQTFMNKTSRIKNSKRIILKTKPDPEKTYIILDDVVTTGSTLKRCKQLLENNKVKKVILCALAKS